MRVLALLFLFSVNLTSQTSLKNAVYLIDFSADYEVNKISYLSSFAKNRYVNQPYFIDDRRVLVSADEDGDGLTDIIEINVNDKSYIKVTDTRKVSEFSPKVDLSKLNITCIVQEGTLQSLHSYPRIRDNAGQKIAELRQPGYYELISKDELIYFSVDTPNKLILFNVNTKTEVIIDTNIGRSFFKVMDNIFYSVNENGVYTLKSYDLKNRTYSILEVLPGQDFIVDDNMNFYATKGSEILKRDIYKGDWDVIVDLKNQQINNLSRLAKKGNKMVVINTL
jgi:hypothetical protein